MSIVRGFSTYIKDLTDDQSYKQLMMEQPAPTNDKKRGRSESEQVQPDQDSSTVTTRASKRIQIDDANNHAKESSTSEWRTSADELRCMLDQTSDVVNESLINVANVIDGQIEQFALAEFHRGLDGERRNWQHLGQLWAADVQQVRKDLEAIESHRQSLASLDVSESPASMQLDWFIQHYRECERRLNQREKDLKERENRCDVRVKQARQDAMKEITELREKLNLLRTANDMSKSKDKRERKLILDKAEEARKLAEVREKQAVDEVRRLLAVCAQLQEDMNNPRVKREPSASDNTSNTNTALQAEINRLNNALSTARSEADSKQLFVDELQAALATQSAKLREREKAQIALNETIAKLESDLLEANMKNEIFGL